MIIQITKEHIDKGLRITSWDANPVALAIADQGFQHVCANWSLRAISFHNGLMGCYVSMPQEVYEWLIKWDNFLITEPFEFEFPTEMYEKKAA